MKQTWKNDKKTPNIRRDFGQFVPNLHPQNFIRGFFLY